MRSSAESEGAFVAVSVGESTLFLELVNAQTGTVLGKGRIGSLASLLPLGVFRAKMWVVIGENAG